MIGGTRMRLEGGLAIGEVAAQHARLCEWVAGGLAELDLSEVAECDTAGVQLLLALRRAAAAGGRSLHLVQPSPAVAEAARRLGAAELLA